VDQLGGARHGLPAVAAVVAHNQTSIEICACHAVRVCGVDAEVKELGIAGPRLPYLPPVVADQHPRRGRVRSVQPPLGDDQRVEVNVTEQ